MSKCRTTAEPSSSEILASLQELVEALDRRVPHLDRAGEIQIAKDAASLRNEAVTRIAALQLAGPNHATDDQGLADAVMTDDGNPAPGRSVGGQRRPGVTF